MVRRAPLPSDRGLRAGTRELVARTRTGTAAQRAYALGYLSHIATDVVGHPYVNQVAGGPYRLQVQRHVTCENFMDAWEFQQRFGESVNRKLVQRLSFAILESWAFDDAPPLDAGALLPAFQGLMPALGDAGLGRRLASAVTVNLMSIASVF